MGGGRTVEVPRGRLRRSLGRAARGSDRDSVVREPSIRPRRARAPAGGFAGRRGRNAADGSRRRPRQRQLGIVDGQGRAATDTGDKCHEWAGGRTGSSYAAQGNILVSAETVDALAETFESTAGEPLAVRLLDCLDAAQAAGGDRRGQQSAALLVVGPEQGYAGLSDVFVDLRVDDHERPLEELRRLFVIHQQLFGRTPRSEWTEVNDDLRKEIEDRLAALGFERLEDWAGVENLEERVHGDDAIDPFVLDALRRKSG